MGILGTFRARWLWGAAAVAVVAALAVTAAAASDRGRGAGPAGDGGPVTDGGSTLPISVSGDRILRDGEPWWFLGYNSFVWSGNCGEPQERMSADQVDAWFASMRHDGHGAVRLFYFPGWDAQRLEQAVAAARNNGIYVTITLGDALDNCGQERKDAAWFDDEAKTAQYQSHLEATVARYRDDPTVAWFEYLNEPGRADGRLRGFYDRMGAVGKAVDPGRLFASGTIAPYALDGEENYREVHASPGVDIASLHEYDENQVESVHGPPSRAAADGKPVIVGEFGIEAGEGCDISFDERAGIARGKAGRYTTDGYVGALLWAWQPGGQGCELGNVDQDPATQEALRTSGPATS